MSVSVGLLIIKKYHSSAGCYGGGGWVEGGREVWEHYFLLNFAVNLKLTFKKNLFKRKNKDNRKNVIVLFKVGMLVMCIRGLYIK